MTRGPLRETPSIDWYSARVSHGAQPGRHGGYDQHLCAVQALVTLHGLHGLAVLCKLASPALYNPFSGYRDWLSIILLNSFNLAVACRSVAGTDPWSHGFGVHLMATL